MKMSKYFICCEECFRNIGLRNTKAAKLWMEFCAMRMEMNGVFLLDPKNIAELRILENMGYIVSTDQNEYVAVKVKGYMNSERGEPFFCVKVGMQVNEG